MYVPGIRVIYQHIIHYHSYIPVLDELLLQEIFNLLIKW